MLLQGLADLESRAGDEPALLVFRGLARNRAIRLGARIAIARDMDALSRHEWTRSHRDFRARQRKLTQETGSSSRCSPRRTRRASDPAAPRQGDEPRMAIAPILGSSHHACLFGAAEHVPTVSRCRRLRRAPSNLVSVFQVAGIGFAGVKKGEVLAHV